MTITKKPVTRRKAKRPAPSPQPSADEKKAKERPSDGQLVASALEKLVARQETMIEQLIEEIKNIKLSTPQPIMEWRLHVVRDDDTLLASDYIIKAETPKNKLLN